MYLVMTIAILYIHESY